MPIEDGTPPVEVSSDTDTGDTTASSPEAQADTGGDAPGSMLEAIEFGLKQANGDDDDADSDPASPQSAESEDGTAAPKGGADDGSAASDPESPTSGQEPEPLPDEVSPEEMKRFAPRTRERVQQLLQQRAELREQNEAFAPHAEVIRQNNLGNEDVQAALGLIASLQRGQFQEFLDGVAPFVVAAQTYMGQALPADLQEQVQRGYITQDLAREYAKARAQSAWTQGQLEKQQAEVQQQTQREQAQRQQVALNGALSKWETQVRGRDPDFAQKEQLLRVTTRALVQERGRPKTVDEVVKYAQDAYEKVNEFYASRQPKPNTRPTPSTAASARPGVSAPKSMDEAIAQGLSRARR